MAEKEAQEKSADDELMDAVEATTHADRVVTLVANADAFELFDALLERLELDRMTAKTTIPEFWLRAPGRHDCFPAVLSVMRQAKPGVLSQRLAVERARHDALVAQEAEHEGPGPEAA